jgi:hypothetical protein
MPATRAGCRFRTHVCSQPPHACCAHDGNHGCLVDVFGPRRGAGFQASRVAKLHALVSDAKAGSAAVEAEQAAKVTLDLTRKQNQSGHVNYLALLSAEQAYQQTLAARVQAQNTRFGDTAALYQALGGGWWHRDEQKTASR